MAVKIRKGGQWVTIVGNGPAGPPGPTGPTGPSGPSGSNAATDKIEEGNTSVETIDTGTNGKIIFETEGSDRWEISSAGHLLPVDHEDYDIGSASRKVRHLFLSDNSLKFVGADDVERAVGITNGNLTFMGSQLLTVSLTSPSEGEVLEYNGTVWANKAKTTDTGLAGLFQTKNWNMPF